MTPYFEKNKYQPLSHVSVAALADLGYRVNMVAADPLTLEHHGPNNSYGNNGTDNYYGHHDVKETVQGDTNDVRSLKEIWSS